LKVVKSLQLKGYYRAEVNPTELDGVFGSWHTCWLPSAEVAKDAGCKVLDALRLAEFVE